MVQQVGERYTWRKLSVDLNSWMKQIDESHVSRIADSSWDLHQSKIVEECSKPVYREVHSVIYEHFSAILVNVPSQTILFDRIKKEGIIFTTKKYFTERKLKRRDTLFYSHEMDLFGEVIEIFKVKDKHFVLYNIFQTEPTPCKVNCLPYAQFGRLTSRHAIIPLVAISRKCVMLQFTVGDCMMCDANAKEGSRDTPYMGNTSRDVMPI